MRIGFSWDRDHPNGQGVQISDPGIAPHGVDIKIIRRALAETENSRVWSFARLSRVRYDPMSYTLCWWITPTTICWPLHFDNDWTPPAKRTRTCTSVQHRCHKNEWPQILSLHISNFSIKRQTHECWHIEINIRAHEFSVWWAHRSLLSLTWYHGLS